MDVDQELLVFLAANVGTLLRFSFAPQQGPVVISTQSDSHLLADWARQGMALSAWDAATSVVMQAGPPQLTLRYRAFCGLGNHLWNRIRDL